MAEINPQIITHIFASVQSLEKYVKTIEREIEGKHPRHTKTVKTNLLEQQRIVREMRRTANLLQLQLAKKQYPQAVRSMKIFYGLNQMVRGDVMTASSILTGVQTTSIAKNELARPAQIH